MLVALVVVSGLLAAAPAACWCPADDHVGQLLHPRFGHTHASDHAPATLGEVDAHDDLNVTTAPAWSSVAGLGLSQWQAGVQVLPPVLTALRPDAGIVRLAVEVARPVEYVAGPAFPPPR